MSHSRISEYLQIKQSRYGRRPGREARHTVPPDRKFCADQGFDAGFRRQPGEFRRPVQAAGIREGDGGEAVFDGQLHDSRSHGIRQNTCWPRTALVLSGRRKTTVPSSC